MKALMMMLAVVLSVPLFAADGTGDNPATLEDVLYDIATLRRELADLSAKVGNPANLGLEGALGDLTAVKAAVTNRGVQMVEFRFTPSSSIIGSWPDAQVYGLTHYAWPMTPTYVDRGGSIPGVVVNASNGVTLPPGTYLFRLPLKMKGAGEYQNTERGGVGAGAPASVVSSNFRWISWRWTGAAGHATERLEGDVVWPMQDVGVFTFTSATTIKGYHAHVTRGATSCQVRLGRVWRLSA